MIVVKMELWPGGDQSRMKTLGTINIVNDGTGTWSRGNYDVFVMQRGKGKGHKVWRRGKVTGHSRLSKSPYYLLLAALQAAIGK